MVSFDTSPVKETSTYDTRETNFSELGAALQLGRLASVALKGSDKHYTTQSAFVLILRVSKLQRHPIWTWVGSGRVCLFVLKIDVTSLRR